MEDCKHKWDLGQPKVEANKRITHEKCCLCKGERDLVEDRFSGESYYTDIAYQIKPVRRAAKGGNPKVKKRYYDDNKTQIIIDLNEIGENLTCEKWGIPTTSMIGIKKRWGLPKGKIKPKDVNTPLSPGTIGNGQAGNNQALIRYYKSLGDRLSEIKADMAAGLNSQQIRDKYRFSKGAWLSFRRRHGLNLDLKSDTENTALAEALTLFAKVLSQSKDINQARSMWDGVKIAKGYHDA